jgi:hypothetical protein
MALANLFRTYPVTIWLGVGLFSYAWKTSLVASVYQNDYAEWAQQRRKELENVK